MDGGADMIFPDGITDLEELERCVSEIGAPIHHNMSVLDASTYVSLSRLEEIGVSIVSNPAGLLRASMKAMWDYAHGFAAGGTDFMKEADRGYVGHPTGNLHAFAGFSEIRKLEETYLPKTEIHRRYTESLGFQP